jgi:hypothetical protein
VDILPIQLSVDNKLQSIGLILRHTPHQGPKWCTVGGRLLYAESIAEGISPQLYDALGERIFFQTREVSEPLYVAQYSPSKEIFEGFDAVDPRKHAIGLTYAVSLTGEITPQNEAIDFKWYNVHDLPSEKEIGFNQMNVIDKCLEKLLGTPSAVSYGNNLD